MTGRDRSRAARGPGAGSLRTPLVGVFLSWLLLGHPITFGLVVGLVLVTGGSALVTRPAGSRRAGTSNGKLTTDNRPTEADGQFSIVGCRFSIFH
jgi:hypothetical protein